jgi:hypothetical protein
MAMPAIAQRDKQFERRRRRGTVLLHLSATHLIARLLLPFGVLSSSAGCRNLFSGPPPAAPAPVLAAGALLPSPRLIIGRIVAVNETQRLAFIELAADAPNAALIAGTELTARTLDLRNTARLEVSAYVRGRTLGTKIVGGQPSPGDEVVWLAP